MPLRRLLLTLWLAPHTLLALGGSLPIDSELAAQRDVELELHNATVTVVVDPDERPWIKAVPQKANVESAAALNFDWTEGPLRVVRGDGVQGAERIVVEIIVAPTQRLAINGVNIDLTVGAAAAFDGTRDPEDDDPNAGGAGGSAGGGAAQAVAEAPRQRTPTQPEDENDSPYRYEINVEGGQVDVAALRDIMVAATGAVVRIHDTAGVLSLTVVDGSEAEILAHAGPSTVKGIGSDIALVDSVTNVTFDLDATNAILRDGRGELTVNSIGALLALDNWQGHTKLTARDGPIEIRGGVGNANLTVEGAGLDVSLDGWQGRVSFKQSGGSLRASGWQGHADVSVTDGTEVELTSLAGPLTLTMKSNSRGSLDGLEGQLHAEVANAELTFQNVTTLDLKAQRATIVGSAITRLNHFEVATSSVDLDLTQTQGRPNIRLRREVRADVRLAAPCYVVLEGNDAASREATVNGCDLLIGRTRPGRDGTLGASRHFLTVTMAPDAELDVEGVP